MTDDLGACIEVSADGRLHLRSGQLRAQRVHGPADRPRVALIQAGALLLGGDRVRLQVRLAAGTRLDLVEVAGTVAYPGPPSSWAVELELGSGAELRFAGKPFVIAAGATVDRRLEAELAGGARLRLRETLVLGRHAEVGGPGAARSRIRVDGVPVMIEELSLDPAIRALPGILGDHRVVDTITSIGTGDPPGDVPVLRLPDHHGWLARWLGADLAASPLNPVAITGR